MGLLVGLLEIPLGVLALAEPRRDARRDHHRRRHLGRLGRGLRVVLSFEIKRLPHDVDETYGVRGHNGPATREASTPVAAS